MRLGFRLNELYAGHTALVVGPDQLMEFPLAERLRFGELTVAPLDYRA